MVQQVGFAIHDCRHIHIQPGGAAGIDGALQQVVNVQIGDNFNAGTLTGHDITQQIVGLTILNHLQTCSAGCRKRTLR